MFAFRVLSDSEIPGWRGHWGHFSEHRFWTPAHFIVQLVDRTDVSGSGSFKNIKLISIAKWKAMLSLNISLLSVEQWLCTTWCGEHLLNQVSIRLFCFHVFNNLSQHIYILLFIRNEIVSDLLPCAVLHIPPWETRFNVSIINSGLAWEELSLMVFFGIIMAVGAWL